MTSRSEIFILNGLEVLAALTSFVLGAIYLSRIVGAYFSRYPTFHLSYILNAAFSLRISLTPLPLELPLVIGLVASFGLIYLCYYLLKMSYYEFKRLEETQFLLSEVSVKNEEEE